MIMNAREIIKGIRHINKSFLFFTSNITMLMIENHIYDAALNDKFNIGVVANLSVTTEIKSYIGYGFKLCKSNILCSPKMLLASNVIGK